jgi:hypothetical protein
VATYLCRRGAPHVSLLLFIQLLELTRVLRLVRLRQHGGSSSRRGPEGGCKWRDQGGLAG